MWLDRLSGHATPPSKTPSSPSTRSYSPASRIPAHQLSQTIPTRHAFAPRTSSLSVPTHDSMVSLLQSAKKTNGSSSKPSTQSNGFVEPSERLAKLLDEGPHRAFHNTKHDSIQESNSVTLADDEELNFGGLTLQELARQDIVGSLPRLNANKSQTVEDYDGDKAKFEGLHHSIRACDDILSSVERNLAQFQNDLGAVSAEIETLQARSTALSMRLENRRVVERGLGPIVQEITLAPAIVQKIVEDKIDESWVKALGEVEKRSKALHSRSKEQRSIKGINDLRPLLDKLVNKASEKIRDFLVLQIKTLRSPNINAQIIQQEHFLQFRDLYAFLSRHHGQLAGEIGQAYLNTMRWYYLNQFTRYEKALSKMQLYNVDKHDLIGLDDASRKTNIMTGSKGNGLPHDAFNLGRRIDLLKNSSHNAISSYLVEEDKSTHYLEFPFRHFNIAMIDNASAEYSFMTAFFTPSLTLGTISRNFNYIFEPTFTLAQNLTKSLVLESVDCLGLLLCVRLNQHLAFELQRRKIPAVDGYINGTSMLLWPRFQVIVDMHCDSLRKTSTGLGATKAPASKVEQARQSAAPHFITQRFGQFLHGILALSTEAGDDEPVSTSLGRLRNEMEALLTKLGKQIGEPRKRERFLYNNYSLILTIVGDVEGKLAGEQREHFEDLKKAFSEGG